MKTLAAVVVAILLGLILASCSPLHTEYAPIRYVNFKVYDPVYVGIEKGFFKQHGIEVEIVGDVLAGPTAIQAVSGGSAEAGLSSIPALVNANASGLPVSGITDIQSAIGTQALEEYFVLADSNIQSIDELRGKTIAVNLWKSSFHYTLLMALEQHGIAEDEVTFVLLPFDKQEVALNQGQVDVIGLMEPYASHARATYGDKFRLLFTALDVFGEKQFTCHFVNRVWAEYNTEKAEAFTAGIVDAINWIEANQDEAKAIIAQYTGIDEQYVPEYHFQPDGRVNEADVQFWLEYMRRRGDITADWLTPEQVASNRYNAKLSP